MKANLSNFQYSQAADFLSPVFSLPITHSGHLQLFSATCSANALTTPPSSFFLQIVQQQIQIIHNIHFH